MHAAPLRPTTERRDDLFACALDVLEQLLARQHAAILDDRADDLPAVCAELRNRLAAMVGEGLHTRSAAERLRVQALQARARLNQSLIVQRETAVQRALDALGHASPVLRSAQANRVYAAAGVMGAPALRGQALAHA